MLAILATLVLVFWNPRGISNKELIFKNFLDQKEAVYAGVPESQTYRSSAELSDARWRWEGGAEGKPSEKGGKPSRGLGAFIDSSKVEGSLIHTGKYTSTGWKWRTRTIVHSISAKVIVRSHMEFFKMAPT